MSSFCELNHDGSFDYRLLFIINYYLTLFTIILFRDTWHA